ncbi:Gfo/Idh/MocA family protein [Georgenia deserti]|uniref:Gfo/Idh/MocA family protein n=1 Tax=Georgenia deserti TaxID=2093781 RepID=A0ABW4L8W2_9MICO
MPVRVAVVGAGLMGRLHAEIYQAEPGVDLVAIVEPDRSAHAELSARFRVPVHGDVGDVLDAVDALSVCTPDDIRRDILLPAFARGVRVLVEKPLATSLEEADELIAACPSPDALMVGHLLRFDPRVAMARAALERGDVGEVWAVRCWRNNSTAVGDRIAPRTSVDWFLGIHDVDLVRHVTGLEITSVRATASSVRSHSRDLVRGELTFENGRTAQVSWSWLLPPQRPSGLHAGIEVIGSDGMVEVDLSHNAVALTTAGLGRQTYLDTYHWPAQQGVPAGDLQAEIRAFLATSPGSAPPVTAADGRKAVAVVSAIESSTISGRTVDVARG